MMASSSTSNTLQPSTATTAAGGAAATANPFPFLNLETLATISNRKFFCIAVLIMLVLILSLVSKIVDVIQTADKDFVKYLHVLFFNRSDVHSTN